MSFDIGGTSIKSAIFNDKNEIVKKLSVDTQPMLKKMSLAKVLFEIIKMLENETNILLKDSVGIGIGVPGFIDTRKGIIYNAGNLHINNYNLKAELQELTNMDNIKIYNDSYVATFAELKVGGGKKFDNFLLLTVGTGIGSGIVLNGSVRDVPCEIGHAKFTHKRIKCNCGEYGCFETIASASALVRMVKEKLKKNSDCEILKHYSIDEINGKIVFEFANDKVVKSVLNNYIKNLGHGIINYINMLLPQAVILSGAIAQEEEHLIKPLQRYVNKHTFFRKASVKVKVLSSMLHKDTGLIGAKLLLE